MQEVNIDFVEFKEKSLKGYTLIEGFPGMGLVGTIAAKYVVEKLRFDFHGFIRSNMFMPVIRIHKGLPIQPSRIYISEPKKLVVLISEQVIPKMHVNAMAKATVDWIQKKQISTVISLSGINAGENENSMIYGIAANQESHKLLEEHKLQIIEDGITTGVTAMMLLEMKRTSIKAISLLGNVKIGADYHAAAEVLKKLTEILDLKLDVAPLLKEAQELEKELVKQLQSVKDTKDSTEKFEGVHPPMYA